jgi:hypothetical protein
MLDKVVPVVVHLDLTTVEQPVMVHKEILEEAHRNPEVVQVEAVDVVLLVTEDKVMVEDLVETVVHISHMVVQLDSRLAVVEVVQATTTVIQDMVETVEVVEVLPELILRDLTQQVLVVEPAVAAVVVK